MWVGVLFGAPNLAPLGARRHSPAAGPPLERSGNESDDETRRRTRGTGQPRQDGSTLGLPPRPRLGLPAKENVPSWGRWTLWVRFSAEPDPTPSERGSSPGFACLSSYEVEPGEESVSFQRSRQCEPGASGGLRGEASRGEVRDRAAATSTSTSDPPDRAPARVATVDSGSTIGSSGGPTRSPNGQDDPQNGFVGVFSSYSGEFTESAEDKGNLSSPHPPRRGVGGSSSPPDRET